MKRIYVNEEYCIACRLCEVHCLVQHSQSKKIIKAYKEEAPQLMPRLVFEEEGPLSFAMPCRHCADAPCLHHRGDAPGRGNGGGAVRRGPVRGVLDVRHGLPLWCDPAQSEGHQGRLQVRPVLWRRYAGMCGTLSK
jgi:ferredoxin